MQNWDRVWARLSKSDAFRKLFGNAKQDDFRYLGVGQQFSLTASQAGTVTPVNFPQSAIILAISAGLNVSGQNGTTLVRDLSAVRVQIQYPDGDLVTGGQMNGAALWGYDGTRAFPAKELLVSKQGTLNYTVTNLVSTAITLDIVHHCMVQRSIG